jgi:hypothetical protein
MCFSAEVSFGAAAVITTMGVIAFKKAERTPFRFLAFIPIVFGLQQFIEGFVWLGAAHEEYANLLQLSTYFFIIIAWVIWPIYIPFAIWKIEKDPFRKKILLVLVFIGIIVTACLIYILFTAGIEAKINDCSIIYDYGANQTPNHFFSILYLSTTVLPNLVSKVGKMWVLGIMNLITYFVSRIYFHDRVISVWCFFAAVSSIVILIIIMDEKKKERRAARL